MRVVVVELLDELEQQVLKLGEPLAAAFVELLEIALERLEPLVHRRSLLDEGGVAHAGRLAVPRRDHAFTKAALFDAPDHALRAELIGQKRLTDSGQQSRYLTRLLAGV